MNKAVIKGMCVDTKKVDSDKIDIFKCTIYTKDKVGENEYKEYHHVTFFGKSAGWAERDIKKDSIVFVCGRINTSSYDKNGEKRYKTEIIAEDYVASEPIERKESSSSSSSGFGS